MTAALDSTGRRGRALLGTISPSLRRSQSPWQRRGVRTLPVPSGPDPSQSGVLVAIDTSDAIRDHR
jgi:hypothetical protein